MRIDTFKKIALLTLCTFAAVAIWNGNSADAKRDAVGQVKANNAKFSEILNAKSDPEILMEFLHNTIDNDAKITISVKDPQNQQAGAVEMNITKTDYINSYLYGPRQVKNYRADIKTLNAEMDAATNTVTTKEIMTESGIMLNPHDYSDPGRPYTSYTSCESQYSVQSGEPTLTKATCKTQIAYEESV